MSRAVAGTRLHSSRHLPPLRHSSPGLTVPGWLCRVRGGGGACAADGFRALHPAFWASPVRPAPVRVLSSRVPARKFKDPGGRGVVALSPVGHPREGFPVPPPTWCSLRLSRPPLAAGASRGSGRGAVSRTPSGRPWGPSPSARFARPLGGRRRVLGSQCPMSHVSGLSVPDPVSFFHFTCIL